MTHVLDPLIGYLDQKPTEGCACKICEGCREGLRILVAAREGRQSEDLEIACRRAGNNGYQRGRAEGRREAEEVFAGRGEGAVRGDVRRGAEPMTHVLDRMIEEVEALAGALRRRDQNTLGGKTSNSERELYESAEESLRILRAEREGKHASPCVRRSLGGRRRAVCAYLADGTKVRVARSDHTKGPAWLEVVPTERLTLAESVNDEADSVNDAGSSVNDGRADELRAEREGTRAEDEGVYGSTRGRFVTPVLARLEEARAEGRREERERVVAWLNKRSEEAPSGPPYGGGPEEYMVLDGVAACIEDGDHWRGGESP